MSGMTGWQRASGCTASNCVEVKRSSRCTAGSCVEVEFRTSSTCASSSCVEVGNDGDEVLVRDSKNPGQPPLRFTRDEWAAFVAGAKAGEFDG